MMENYVICRELAEKLKVRFNKHVDKQDDGCWIWTGGKNSEGYGNFYWDGTVKAHRASYMLYVGDIPEGKQLDHLCRNRACVNPEHLEPVTNQQNAQRGVLGLTTATRQRSKTHCPKGHEYTPENTKLSNGKRACRTCSINFNRQYRAEGRYRKVAVNG